ncbi:deuterolysin metalloprotease [Ophiocordyceps sinensis CO18]|uniref:Deuterolysin metalloprotease n=1 Tax=Ophiocordyceps sinensis (strain Co18 / CGMCC 3.14243) TaxID=911162 RepID=T5AME1_OPHSC|nr:deuterolysin metalloprotease [Ophiocordyceps sinensis CO18]
MQPYEELTIEQLSQMLAADEMGVSLCGLEAVLAVINDDLPDDADDLPDIGVFGNVFDDLPEEEEAANSPSEPLQPWGRFVQLVQQRFGITEQPLRTFLDNGIEWLQSNRADVYELLQQTFPDVLDVLGRMSAVGLRFSFCLPDNRPPSKRSFMPAAGLSARDDKAKDLLCAELVAALGDEGKHGTGKGAPSAPTTSEPPAAPENKGDRKAESEKVLVEAQKLQASGDGSFEAKLLGGLFTAALGGGALAYGAATTEGEVFLAGLAVWFRQPRAPRAWGPGPARQRAPKPWRRRQRGLGRPSDRASAVPSRTPSEAVWLVWFTAV